MQLSNTAGIIIVAIPTTLLGAWVAWEFIKTYLVLHQRQYQTNLDNDDSQS